MLYIKYRCGLFVIQRIRVKYERMREMKQLLALCFAAILLFGLCACGGESGVQNQTDAVAQTREPTETVSDEGEKIPSEEMIEKDVSDKLTAKNPYASLTGIETVKSLTEEGHYEITLSATAETKYADWVYEAELEYTKYDQGWMMDDIDWLQEEYTITREPTGDEIAEILNEMFPDVDALYGGWEYAFPVETGSILPPRGEDEGVRFEWIRTIELMHAKYEMEVTSSWHYDPLNDNWVLNETDSLEGLKDQYAVFFREGDPEVTADFTGEWAAAGGASSIMISDFTADGFTAELEGEVEYFTQRSSNGSVVTYAGESHYILLGFYDDNSTIIRKDFLNNIDFIAYVKEELPALEN